MQRLRLWAKGIKGKTIAVFIAARDPRTPLLATCVAVAVAVYALSPIDLIPDFIPVLGHLDDLIIVPAGLWLAIRLIPVDVMADALVQARETEKNSIWSRYIGAAGVLCLWSMALVWIMVVIASR